MLPCRKMLPSVLFLLRRQAGGQAGEGQAGRRAGRQGGRQAGRQAGGVGIRVSQGLRRAAGWQLVLGSAGAQVSAGHTCTPRCRNKPSRRSQRPRRPCAAHRPKQSRSRPSHSRKLMGGGGLRGSMRTTLRATRAPGARA